MILNELYQICGTSYILKLNGQRFIWEKSPPMHPARPVALRKGTDLNDAKKLVEEKQNFCVIISGDALPPSTTGENCINVVREIARNNLKIQLSEADISTAHRIGRKPATQHPDRRSIIAKLCRRSTKSDLMFACKNQPEDSPRVYVNDSLTPIRNTIMYSLRQIRRAHPRLVTGCSSYDGKVYAYTKDPIAGRRDRRHLVNSHSDLIKFCSEHVKQPLEAFLESWSH